jgi:1,4-alpha-glucan branching enzyme
MPTKTYYKGSQTCLVLFEVPADMGAESVCHCGDFNGWVITAHPMMRQADSRFQLMLDLETRQIYRYRFLLDGHRWENDAAADGYIPNPFGSVDSIIEV